MDLLWSHRSRGRSPNIMRIPGLAVGQVAHGDGFTRLRQIALLNKLVELAKRRNDVSSEGSFGPLAQSHLLDFRDFAGKFAKRPEHCVSLRFLDHLIFDLLRHIAERNPRRRNARFNPLLQ